MRRTVLLLLMIFSVFALSLNCQTKAADEKAKACRFLSFAEAEKILGQPVELVDNLWTFTADQNVCDCAYRGIEKDAASGQAINLFFKLEESATVAQAQQIYERIWQSNKTHKGIEVLSGIGDQAYAHSDQTNFHFVIARKGKFTVRMKVNKAAETTSLEELKKFAKRVIVDL